MTDLTSYAPGTPCWVDLSTPDVDAAAEFYRRLLGWDVPERPDSQQAGGYRRAVLDGAEVAGMVPLMQEGQPTAWSTYVSVADAEATAAAVGDNGGTVLIEPMDIMGFGKMAVFVDPTGAFCGIWEPGTFAGAERVNESGCWSWNELGTRDVEAARAFYGAVFGWEAERQDMGEGGSYWIWKSGGEMVAGMLDLVEKGVPAEVPAHWLVYFTVEDADAAAATAREQGGDVAVGPFDIPMGRFAVLSDRFGAIFAVMQPSREAPAGAGGDG